MEAALRRALGEALGAAVVESQAVGGGDINLAVRARLSDGRDVFVKHGSRDPAMYPAEAAGLRWLGEADALPLPEALAVSSDFLALQWVPRGAGSPSEAVGHGLARLHRAGSADGCFGLDHANFIGSLPQDNTPAGDWAEFYRDRRLVPQIRRADALLGCTLRHDLDRLLERLPDRVGPSEPPARLHGDLWGGNLLVDQRGDPWLIDPAAHAGHREVDLAMMLLFGGFDDRVFSAYHEVYPLERGWRARVPLYQLYYLLVHVNLFGAGYVPRVQGAVRAVL